MIFSEITPELTFKGSLSIERDKLTLWKSQACAPLIEGDAALAVGVALVEEGGEAVLQGLDGGGDGEQLVGVDHPATARKNIML